MDEAARTVEQSGPPAPRPAEPDTGRGSTVATATGPSAEEGKEPRPTRAPERGARGGVEAAEEAESEGEVAGVGAEAVEASETSEAAGDGEETSSGVGEEPAPTVSLVRAVRVRKSEEVPEGAVDTEDGAGSSEPAAVGAATEVAADPGEDAGVESGSGSRGESEDDSADAPEGDSADDDDDEDAGRRRRLPAWVELPLLLLLGLGIVVVLHSYVAQPFVIPSGSMEHTLDVGDRVLVNKQAYTFGDRPQRGDVVVFDGTGVFTSEDAGGSSNPIATAFGRLGSMFGFGNSDETDFVKRVIGIGGDTVVCCDAQGRITVNGVPLDEASYLYPGDVPSTVGFSVIVPEGELWVMGDHRGNSADSREYMGRPGGGFVPEDRVVGRVDWIIWPVSRMGGVDRPSTFSQPGIGVQRHPAVPGRG